MQVRKLIQTLQYLVASSERIKGISERPKEFRSSFWGASSLQLCNHFHSEAHFKC